MSSTKKNPGTLAQYKAALEAHIESPSTQIHGTDQYVPDSTAFFNSSTNNVVVLGKTGKFITGWKLNPGTPQYENYIHNGVLR